MHRRIEGKKALGRIGEDSKLTQNHQSDSNPNNVSLPQVMKLITKLREDNPEFQIIFEAKLKKRRGKEDANC